MSKTKNPKTDIIIPLENMGEKEQSLILAYAEELETSPGNALTKMISEIVRKNLVNLPADSLPNQKKEIAHPSLSDQKSPPDKEKYLLLSPSSYECLLMEKKIILDREIITHPKNPKLIHLEENGVLNTYATIHTMKDGRLLLVSYYKLVTNYLADFIK